MLTLADPEKTIHDLTEEEIDFLAGRVDDDFMAAEQSRTEREQRALEDLRLYLRQDKEVEQSRIERKGWSKIRVPLIYWMVETVLPRLGVNPPTVTVTARSPEAVPYAFAKQQRLQHLLRRGGWERQALLATKQMLILGDAPVKVPWDQDNRMPRMLHVPWWDFFLSHEAADWETAEVYFHRTWLTERAIAKLAEAEAEDGRPLWGNLEEAAAAAATRDVSDATWSERMDAAGYGSRSAGTERPLTPVIEAWYADGSYVVLAGAHRRIVIRSGRSPFKDRRGNPVRPFAMFQGTPDLEGPYSLSMASVLEDHQVEMSTLRNQETDQRTGNINAGVVHTDAVADEDVEEFLAQPNGRLRLEGVADVRTAFMRVPPGQVGGDVTGHYELLRSEAQMASGVSDISAGQTTAGGLDNSTATGMSIIQAESNKRVQLMVRMHEIAMSRVAVLYDCHDRQFGQALLVEVEANLSLPPGTLGVAPVTPENERSTRIPIIGEGRPSPFASGFAQVNTEANLPVMDYTIEVDAGSTARPDQLEEAQKHLAFLSAATNFAPIAERIDWDEATRRLIEVHGMNPDRIMLTPAQRQAALAAQAPPPAAGAPAPEQTAPPVAEIAA